jgi:hypothetical protein
MNGRKGILCATVFGVLLLSPCLWAIDEDADGVDDAFDVCCETPADIEVDDEGRPVGDVDGDCDVDLIDHRMMQNGFTGPLTASCCFDADCDDSDSCTIDVCNEAIAQCEYVAVPDCGGPCLLAGSCSLALECDVPIDGNIGSASENDFLCFCVGESDMVRITLTERPGSGSNFNPEWRLLDNAGNAPTSCGTFSTLFAQDCGPLPAAGSPYQLHVHDNGQNDTGFYSASVRNLTAASACEDVSLGCEVLAGTIHHVADGDLLSFNVVDGETLRVTVVETTGSGAGFNPRWRLIDAAGRPARGPCGAFMNAPSVDCGPLSELGNPYRLDIEDDSSNDIGSYHAQILRSAPTAGCETPIACDTTVEETITPVGDGDRFSFRVAGSEIVRISVAERSGGAGFVANWRVVDGAGAPAPSCGSATAAESAECRFLPAAGNPYRIEVEDNAHSDIGDYDLHLQRLTAVRACDDQPLACGVALEASIDPALDTDLLSFVVAEGQNVRIEVVELAGSGVNFTPSWRLLDGAGLPMPPTCDGFSATTTRDCSSLDAARNPYRVEVEDSGRNDIGNYKVTMTYIGGCPSP